MPEQANAGRPQTILGVESMSNSASVGAFRGSALTGENNIRFTKVPEVALGFWIIKILPQLWAKPGATRSRCRWAWVTRSERLSSSPFSRRGVRPGQGAPFQRLSLLAAIVATTTLGTTIADFVDRSLGLGYLGGSSILFIAVLTSLAVWRLSEGTVSVNTVATPRVERFTGSPSCFHRPWEPLSAIGSPIRMTSATPAALSFSARRLF